MIHVMLADDHLLVRQGIRLLLECEPDIEVVDEAADGQEIVRKVGEAPPDVVVMDLNMPVMNGVEATKRIKAEDPEVRILALTMHDDPKYLYSALTAGATGYLIKRAAATELVAAVRALYRCEAFLYPPLAKHIVDAYLRGERLHPECIQDGSATLRERELLSLLAQGYTSREIAERMNISLKTVDRHKENLMRKLQLRNRVELVRHALRAGLVAEE